MNKQRVLVSSLFALSLCAVKAHADSYNSLLKRYEKQIRQQENQLVGLRARLQEKEKDVTRWRNKADEAKTSWTQAAADVTLTRAKAKLVHEKRQTVRLQADAAQWKTTENVLLSRSAGTAAQVLACDLYAKTLLGKPGASIATDIAPEIALGEVSQLSASSQQLADQAQKEEAQLRSNEMQLQTEEQTRMVEADKLHARQEAQWMKWQEAQQRKTALEDEISQIDLSAKALQVMVQELRDHRDQAKALRENRSVNDQVLASLKGTLPWPARGKVVQNFGRQYSDGLNQLVISNGIKIETGPSHTIRAIEDGKVLFASAFRNYGQLVIVQHKNGITSVYAGLGQTLVKEGQQLATLDQLGSTSDSGSFYFELRRDEQPINPLVYLSPVATSELSSRRKFR